MSDKSTRQTIILVTLAIIISMVVYQHAKNPHILDLSSQSQHILQNYQSYLKTGQTAIPYNPSPVDLGQLASPNQAGYASQQAYLAQVAAGSLQSNPFSGIPTTYIIYGVIGFLVLAFIISVKRK
jgi:hypothetical protein